MLVYFFEAIQRNRGRRCMRSNNVFEIGAKRKRQRMKPDRQQGKRISREKLGAWKSPVADVAEANKLRVVHAIRSLPSGKVSTYGAVARAAGWPGAARQVVRILRQVPGLPWHRVLGAGGAIKLTGESGAEQRFRLRMEGVTFRGARVDMRRHEHRFPPTKRSTRVPRSRGLCGLE